MDEKKIGPKNAGERIGVEKIRIRKKTSKNMAKKIFVVKKVVSKKFWTNNILGQFSLKFGPKNVGSKNISDAKILGPAKIWSKKLS